MNNFRSPRVGQRLSALCAAVVLASTAFAQAPANDECAGALALNNGVNGPYNNSTATTSTLTFPTGCSTSAPGKDLWFTFTPTVSGTIIFTTCGIATIDTVVEAFDGTGGCAALTSLGCNDDNCSTRSRVVINGTAGTTYYVRVAVFGTGTGGAFNLEVQAPVALTGRSLAFSGSTLPGGTFNANIQHPSSEAGNVYAMLWSLPFNPPTTPVIPGYTVQGQIGVDPANFLTGVTGLLASGTTTPTSLTIPNNPGLFGYPLFGQSIDLDSVNPVVSFADNRVGVAVGANIGKVAIARATTTSFTSGDNDAQMLDDGKVGLAASQGLQAYTYLPTRPRANEGFVEGYPGTNSSTSFDTDFDAESGRKVGRRTGNGAYQCVVTPAGYDISIIRLNGAQNGSKEFGILSLERATGIARRVPGLSFLDGSTTLLPAQNRFYVAVSRDGLWACVNFLDTASPAVNAPKIFAFRTDGQTPAINITPTVATTDSFFDGAMHFTNDFLFVAGSQGWQWTSATSPGVLQPLALPNTTATNAPNVFVFSLSSRVSPDGSSFWIPIGSNAAASRGENDIVRVTNVAGVPVATNHSQFAAATGIAEFGFSGFTPATTNNSAAGIKASVSPDGTKIAFIPCTTTTSTFNGICVADGTANPPVRTVAGAVFYGEVAFINNTTVMFVAGSTTAQALYSLDVPTGTITQVGTATDIRTRGQFWSLNKNWWYFIRSNSAGSRHEIVSVNCATGAVQSITGTEFGTPGAVPLLRTGGLDTGTEALPARHFFLRRAPSGNAAYFIARRETNVASTFEDANVFKFDIETGGTAVQLSNNTGTGAATAVKNIESLTVSADGNHLAWVEKVGTATANLENVFHLNLTTSVITQLGTANATYANVTDSSVRFTGGATPTGVVWVAGSGAVTATTTGSTVFWAPLGSTNATILMPKTADTSTRLYQVIGTN